MKRVAFFILGLFPTLLSCEASASEVMFACSYQLGSGTEANRRKVGTVVVAIDVDAKTARIDFGKGWFKTITLVVDGTDVKETGVPVSGAELGFFYFDLSGNSGGFTGGSDTREFFDGCVRTKVAHVAGMPDQASTPPPAADRGVSNDSPALTPPVAPQPWAAPPPDAKPSPDKLSGKGTNSNPGPVTEAAPERAEQKEPIAPAIAPPAANAQPSPPPQAGGATTDVLSDRDEKAKTAVAVPPAAAVDASPVPVPPKETPLPGVASAAPAGPSAPPDQGQARSDYLGGMSAQTNPSPMPEAPPAPVPDKAAAAADQTPPVANEASPPPATEPSRTEYFGDKDAQAKPVPLPEAAPVATRDVEPATQATAPPTPSPQPAQVAAASPEKVDEPCHDVLSREIGTLKVNFGNSSSNIDESSQKALTRIGGAIKGCQDVEIEVGGHTDNLGNSTNNKRLSLLRAEFVVRFLVGGGVDPSRLKAVGYGQEQPIASNETAVGRRSNRRVELRVSSQPH
ncbi:MAG: OmpA family protein [Hyphomicrobium sp.]|uniref:OmpA family protein n=1 Tax=Hyphomicrobium sp. TaxID=82 RepID=UPI0039E6E0C7